MAWASITGDSTSSYRIHQDRNNRKIAQPDHLAPAVYDQIHQNFLNQPLTNEQFVFASYIKNSKLHDDNILTAESCGLH